MNNNRLNKPAHKEGKKGVSFAYCLPLLILLFGYPIALVKKGGSAASVSQLAFMSNPINLIVLGSGYVLSGLLFIKRFRQNISILLGSRIYLLSLCFVLMTIFVSSFPTKVVVNWLHYVGMTLTVTVAVFYFIHNQKQFFQVLTFWAFTVISLSIVLALFFPVLGIHHIQGRWMGVTSNPNTLGSMCIITVWSSVSGFVIIRAKKFRALNVVTFFGACFCLYKANSVTAIICSLFITAGTPFLLSMKNDHAIKIGLKLFFALFFVALLLLFVWALIPEMLGIDAATKGIGRNATFSGRTELWAYGIKAFAQKPIMGWSFDANATILSTKIMKFGQFHNGYINLAVAGGFFALLFLFLFIVHLISYCFQVLRVDFELGAMYLILILTILIHNMAESSLYSPTNLLWLMFVFTLIYFERYTKRLKITPKPALAS